MQHYERQGYFFNEEIINYYIDLGKKDCSIANEIQEPHKLSIKKELTISKSELFTFFIIYLLRLFVQHYMCLWLSLLKPQSNRFFAVYFKYFLPNKLAVQTFWNSLKLSNFLLSITFKSVDYN